jgi:hypothetical protein
VSSERALWRTVRAKLSPFGRLERVENGAGEGTPDVAYCLRGGHKDSPYYWNLPDQIPVRGFSGWLELKHLGRWPKRADTPVRVSSLTLEQVVWLEEWGRVGGSTYLLLQVASCYLLLKPGAVRDLYEGRLTRRALLEVAVVRGEKRFPTKEILRCLTT